MDFLEMRTMALCDKCGEEFTTHSIVSREMVEASEFDGVKRDAKKYFGFLDKAREEHECSGLRKERLNRDKPAKTREQGGSDAQ